MLYRSTERKAEKVDFHTALKRGNAPDGGLYVPDWFSIGLQIDGESFPDRAGQLLWNFVPRNGLNKLCHEVFNFPVPLRKLSDNLFVLELFHGPTLSFKDFGARFMASSIVNGCCVLGGRKLNIVVATSGDTGSAVANSFYGVPGVNVFVLYPKGRISALQEKQMTTLGDNIFALAVSGDFDDCSRITNEVLDDPDLRDKFSISSANSINIGRLLPQMTYYWEAQHQLRLKYGRSEKPIFVVPSGNFGNLTAGLYARKMGVHSELMVAAVNTNSRIPEYLATGKLRTSKTAPTLSSAMDVDRPRNWDRVVDFFDGDRIKLNCALRAVTVSDYDTKAAIFAAHERFGYVADPHTAVGLFAADGVAKSGFSKTPIIVLSTAHPAKFPEIVEGVIRQPVSIPESLVDVSKMKNLSIGIESDKNVLVKFIKAAQ